MALIDRLGKYRIDAVVGRGSMGVVYRAHDPDIERVVAIKTLPTAPLAASEREALGARFRGEARAYGRLLHTNIVTCYNFEQDGDTDFIVMEYVEGQSLKEHLDRGERFAQERVIAILAQLLDALGYAHAHGVVHRDIKPANVLLTDDGRVKVTDFGIARLDTMGMTQSGLVVGSPSYMSPEQFTGKTVDQRSDLFSAGVILYELLTGERPFLGHDLGEILHSVLHVTPRLPSRLNAEISGALEAVVMKALAKDSAQRYASASEFAAALAAAQHTPEAGVATLEIPEARIATTAASAPTPAPPHVAKPSRRRGWLLGAGGGLVVFALGVGLLREPAPQSVAATASAPASPRPAAPAPGTGVVPVAAIGAAVSASGAIGSTADGALNMKALEASLARLDCAKVQSHTDKGTVVLSGFAQSAEQLATLEAELKALPGVGHIESRVILLAWPYCELMSLLQPYAERPDSAFAPEQDTVHFKAGEPLQLDLQAPPFDGYVYVDYFLMDGTVVHMLPNDLRRDNRVSAGKQLRIGEPGPGKRHWEVSPPFGRELITIVGSKTPLVGSTRPEIEPAREYLAALRSGLAQAQSGDVSANFAFVVTQPR